MKVIGLNGKGGYICEVGHSEIEKFLNLYYNNLDRLGVGNQIDLGKGYDFLSDIKSTFSKTKEFVQSHEKIVKAIFKALQIETNEQSNG